MSRQQVRALFCALALLPHALWAFTLEGCLGLPAACALSTALAVACCWAILAVVADRPRAPSLTRWLIVPLAAHWAGGVAALGIFVPVFIVRLVALEGLFQRTSPVLSELFSTSWILAYCVGIAVASYGTWIERRRVMVRAFEVTHPQVTPALDGYRIAHLSDLHIGSFDPKETGLAWVKRANSLSPNLVVVTGDLVTTGPEFYAAAGEVLEALSAPDGTYIVLGNHDRWDTRALLRELRSRGLRVLQNQRVEIQNDSQALRVAGVDDRDLRHARLDEALADNADGRFTVLLTHHPEFLHDAAARGAHLVLCGHTHGGQIGVPFLSDRLNIATLLGQRARGRFEFGGATMLISAGLGCTGPPLRLGVRPEIGLVVLRSAKHVPPAREADSTENA